MKLYFMLNTKQLNIGKQLFIIENGLFHFCLDIHKFHAKYIRTNDNNFHCAFPSCKIKFSSVLALPFTLISPNEHQLILYPKQYFIGSKKIFTSLTNRKYQILEL